MTSSTSAGYHSYYAHVDGLRAVAVLPVIFYHMGLGASGGYVGVDVFFVISGFLISRLILQEMENNRFHIVEFWERRLRRLFPAALVMMVMSLYMGWLLFLPENFTELIHSALAQIGLSANFYFWMNSGYFDGPAEVKPLLHTWSLAVEEQFYLFFPFLLLYLTRLSRRFSRQNLLPAVLLSMLGASFTFCVFASKRWPSMNFFLLPTRTWELLLGALLVVIFRHKSAARWLLELSSLCGLLLIFAAVFCYDRHTRFPGIAALLPCGGTALVIWANGPLVTFTGRFLASRPLVSVGQASYSLYLWHWPLIVFAKYWTVEPLTVAEKLDLVLVTFLLGFLSWRLVETPFRTRAFFSTRRSFFAFAGGITAVLCAAMILHTSGALRELTRLVRNMVSDPDEFLESEPYENLSPEAQQYAAGAGDFAFRNNLGLEMARAGNFVELGTGDRSLPIGLFVCGDSHAMAILPVIDVLCKEYGVRGQTATYSSTIPLTGFVSNGSNLQDDSIAYQNVIRKYICDHGIGNVILVANWHDYASRGQTERLRQGVADTIASYQESGVKFWFMKQVPLQHGSPPRTLVRAVQRKQDVDTVGLPLAKHRVNEAMVAPIFDQPLGPNVTVLDPTGYFVNSHQICRIARGGKALYWNRDHLSVAGAMELRPLFEPIVKTIADARVGR